MARRLFPFLFLLLALSSCVKEELFTEERRIATDKIVAVYYSAALYSNAEDRGDEVLFEFSDKSSVLIDRSVTVVEDCLQSPLPSVTCKRGWWYVNGSPAGVAETPEVGNHRSKVVCVAYDFDNVYIYMANGNELRISSRPEGALWEFAFLKKNNPCLRNDIVCKIDKNKITATIPPGIMGNELCPTVLFRGTALHVDGILQHNGKSAHLFGGRVKYVLTCYDESELTYEVSIKELYPSVYIDYTADRIHRTSYIDATMKIVDTAHKYWYVDEYESKIQIKGRGNSTWNNFPKKPYHIKLAEKCGIFGMHKNRDFVLLANYSDKSLLRNQVGQKIAEAVGMSWVPESFNVDVYINGDYQGSYDFTEHKEVANHRVDIDLEAGDCYLEIEAKKDNPVWFDTQRMRIPIMFSEPEQPSPELLSEVKNWFNDFETVLVSSYYDDPEKGYEKYVDVESFAKNFIVQELTKNIDADLFKSLFLVKRKGGKLDFYHVWDFDLGIGNCNYLNAHAQVTTGPTGWYVMNHTQEGINTGWYYYMFKGPKFKQVVKRIWQESYPDLMRIPEFIESQYLSIAGSAGRNFTKWSILDTYIWPNIKWLGDYRLEVEYMKDFYSERLEWMNGEISKW